MSSRLSVTDVPYRPLAADTSGSTGSSSCLESDDESIEDIATRSMPKKNDELPILKRERVTVLPSRGFWEFIGDLFACIFCTGRRAKPQKTYQELIARLEKRTDSIDGDATDLLAKIRNSIGYTVTKYREDKADRNDLKVRLDILLFNYCNLIELMKKRGIPFDQKAAFAAIQSLCSDFKFDGVSSESIIRYLNNVKTTAESNLEGLDEILDSLAKIAANAQEKNIQPSSAQERARRIAEAEAQIQPAKEANAAKLAKLKQAFNDLDVFETVYLDEKGPEKLLNRADFVNSNLYEYLTSEAHALQTIFHLVVDIKSMSVDELKAKQALVVDIFSRAMILQNLMSQFSTITTTLQQSHESQQEWNRILDDIAHRRTDEEASVVISRKIAGLKQQKEQLGTAETDRGLKIDGFLKKLENLKSAVAYGVDIGEMVTQALTRAKTLNGLMGRLDTVHTTLRTASLFAADAESSVRNYNDKIGITRQSAQGASSRA